MAKKRVKGGWITINGRHIPIGVKVGASLGWKKPFAGEEPSGYDPTPTGVAHQFRAGMGTTPWKRTPKSVAKKRPLGSKQKGKSGTPLKGCCRFSE